MDAYRLSVYAHIFFSVILTGLALFWTIMLIALSRRFGAEEALQRLMTVNRARWPHVAIPYAWRLPLPWVTWITIAVLVATGVFSLLYRGMGTDALWWTKMALLAAIVLVQTLLTRRPSATLIRANLALVLATIVISGWAIR